MSYQYPPPPGSGANLKPKPKPCLDGNFQIPPKVPLGPSQQVLDSNLFSQEASNEEGKQANIDDQAVTDAALAASAEKRINTLGYHRTQIACGHCRRRKIRCILAPSDLQNQHRCETCIRLKKDCTFNPVERPEPKGQRGTLSSRGLSRASSASHTNYLGCPLQTGHPFPNMAMPPYVGSSDIKRLKDNGFAQGNIGLSFGAQEKYQPDMAAFMQPEPPPSTRPVPDASSYWHVNTQEDLAPIFTQASNPFQQQNWSLGAVDLVSFGPLENLPQQAPYQEVFTNQTSPLGAKLYMHGIPSGDPNLIALSGSTIGSSHIPDPWQQPSSSAPQPWCSYYNGTAQAGANSSKAPR